jgi:hypothetical protein
MQPVVHIGFLPNFKESNTVLLVCDPQALSHLANVALSLASAGAHSVAIHTLPFVIAHEISLEAKLGASDAGIKHSSGNTFVWVRSASGWLSVHQLVQSLAGRESGHQYLDGPSDQASVMLSVGEYSAELWQRAG